MRFPNVGSDRRLRWPAATSYRGRRGDATIALETAAGAYGEVVFSALAVVVPRRRLLRARAPARRAPRMADGRHGRLRCDPRPVSRRTACYAVEHDLPFAPLAFAIGGPGWVPFIAISGFLLLLFPDGHLPSPRWRWFAWLCGVGMTLVFLAIWFYPGDFADCGHPEIANPIGIEALGPVLDVLRGAPVLGAAPRGGRLRLAGRPHASHDRRRRPASDPVAHVRRVGDGPVLPALVPPRPRERRGVGWGDPDDRRDELHVDPRRDRARHPALPPLRHRRRDPQDRRDRDRGGVHRARLRRRGGRRRRPGGLDAALRSCRRSRRASWPSCSNRCGRGPRRFADRIVYGKRATPYEVVATFGDQLAGTYSSDDVLPRLARVLGEGVGAERAEVRMIVDDGLRTVATWPPDAPEAADDLVVEVRHQGQVLGALAVSMPASDPIDQTREQLVQDLAAQAGLVLRNERLTQQLRARLADLQAAQKRLVTAQDGERRRLERNIHDGAQQQLVALQVRQRLVEQLIDRDPAKAKEMVAALQVDTGAALDDLRDLARGIYPPLLADKGLVAALEAQSRKSTVPVTVRSDGVGRLPQEIETAVYFSVLEALQNVAKYAAGEHGRTCRSTRRPGEVRFAVRDDGRGFDPRATGYGTGLQGIADRLGALDGRLEVTSEPGSRRDPQRQRPGGDRRKHATRLPRCRMSASDVPSEQRRDRRLRILASVLVGLVVLGVIVRAFLNAANAGARSDLETGTAFDVLLLVFPAVGLVLVTKRPRNVLGWLMIAIGMAFVMSPGAPYARYATITRDGELPGAGLALAIESPSWVAFIGLCGFLLLLFPDGHLPSRRWRWFARACGVGLTLLFLLILVSPDQGADYGLPQLENPLTVPALDPYADALVALVVFAPLTIVGGAVAVIGRLRRTTDPVQRRQLRWLAWAAGVIAFTYVMAFVPQADPRVRGGIALRRHLRHGRRDDVPPDPDHDRHRGAALPPVRHRLRDPQDRRDRGRRRVHRVRVRRRRGRRRCARRRAAQPAPLGLGGGHRGAGLPATAGAGSTRRGSRRLRRAGDALRGDDHVRRPARGDLLLRRRAASPRPRPRRRRRR